MTNTPTSQALPPRQPFRLSRLWREERTRGVVIQILVVLGFFASVAWLTGNVLANFAALEKSIREQIYTMPDETILLSGHGPQTTVGHEKQFNPFVSA